jgi:hypothetical protein
VIYETEDVRTLAEAGFIARSRGLTAEAGRIFEAVRLMRPGNEAGYIGGALVCMQQGDPAAAIAMLKKTSRSDLALAFTGLALLQLGDRTEAFELLRNVAEFCGDSLPGRLARAVLDEADAPERAAGPSWIRLTPSPSQDADSPGRDEEPSDRRPGAGLQ